MVSSPVVTTTSYRQQKLKSKQIDNLLSAPSPQSLLSFNNNNGIDSIRPPIRILLMGPRNCGIKTFLMNVLDIEPDNNHMVHSLLTVSQRVTQFSSVRTAHFNDLIQQQHQEDEEELPFQERVQRKLFCSKYGQQQQQQQNLKLNVFMYICRGITCFVKWEWKYANTKNMRENNSEQFSLIYQEEGEETKWKMLDEMIEDCRRNSYLNSNIISLYSKIVNYSNKETLQEFYNSLAKASNVRYLDNLQYFFTLENFNRITTKDYNPSNQDLIKAHHSNENGQVISIFRNGFEFIDITGQLNERRKWIHQFSSNSIDSIAFFVPLSDYNLVNPLSGMNRLEETIQLYHEIQRTKLFRGIDISVMLTKMDLFKKKLLGDPISNYFDIFKERESTLKQTMETMRMLFSEKCDSADESYSRRIYVHQVDLTDKSDFEIVYRGFSNSLRLGTLFAKKPVN